MEAVAVVRALEEMSAGRNGEAHAQSLGVIALYPAQAELIRILMARSALLTSAHVNVPVGVPATLAEAEFDTVLISLTRSHAHRAVTFGEGPRALTQALTRARRRLLFFGDVGTMARRSQWEGALDSLDEPAALRERDLIVKLLDYIHGYGCRSEIFLLREGGGTS
jgi:superfamily I DNA and/or RNA helicase